MIKRDPIVIVVGGAAGLAAAVFTARRIGGEHVLVLEKQPRVGKKLLATGNGTCNLSNIHADVSHYHGTDPTFVKPSLKRFSPEDAVAFFRSVGLCTTVREDGRVYPLCAQASAVLDCLRMELERLGVDVRCETTVTALKPDRNGVTVITETASIRASSVLMAAGGAASASLGGSAEVYRLLTDLGHVKTPLFPAIVQIRTDREAVKAVKGIRVDAALTLSLDGREIAASEGEILFADYGVSGPAAMWIGRAAADWERRKKGIMTLSLDVLPTLSGSEVMRDLERRCATDPSRVLENLLTGLLQKRLAQTVLKAAGFVLSQTAGSLSVSDKTTIANTLKNWTLPVTGSAGMNAAQVTAGGLETRGFDAQTMASKLVPHLYAAGEVLDIDGDCGGFNLQWAWSSAFAAATAMTEEWL